MWAESNIKNLPAMEIDMTLPENAKCLRALKVAHSVLKWSRIQRVIDMLEGRRLIPSGKCLLCHTHEAGESPDNTEDELFASFIGELNWHLDLGSGYRVGPRHIRIPQPAANGCFLWDMWKYKNGAEYYGAYLDGASDAEIERIRQAFGDAFNSVKGSDEIEGRVDHP